MKIRTRGSRGMLWLDLQAVDSPTGQRIRTSLGTTDLQLAKAKAKEIIEGARSAGKDLTLGQALERAMRDLWADAKAQQFFESSCSMLTSLLGKDTPLSRIDEAMIQAMVAKLRARGNGTGTINRRLAVLSRLLRAAHREWRVLGRVPFIPRLREAQGRTRTYSDAEQSLILEWFQEFDPEMYRVAFTLFHTGCRVSEVLRIDPARDITAGRLTLRVTKGGSPRTIPVGPLVVQVIGTGLNVTDSDAVAKRWHIMRDALGFSTDVEFVAHTVRHTVATRLLQAGWDVAHVKTWMGHTDVKTTMRYVHLVTSDLEAGAAILSGRPVLRAVS